MSHTTELEVDFKDSAALKAAVEEVGGTWLGAAQVKLYDGTVVDAEAAFKLPAWQYPVALQGGRLHYDNYGGEWGPQATLDKVRQNYTRGVTVKTLKAKGYRVTEHVENGHIRVKATR